MAPLAESVVVVDRTLDEALLKGVSSRLSAVCRERRITSARSTPDARNRSFSTARFTVFSIQRGSVLSVATFV